MLSQEYRIIYRLLYEERSCQGGETCLGKSEQPIAVLLLNFDQIVMEYCGGGSVEGTYKCKVVATPPIGSIELLTFA